MVWVKKYWFFALLLIFLLVYGYTSSFMNNGASKEEMSPLAVSLEEPVVNQAAKKIQEEKATLYIDVKGEVKLPDVYTAEEGERVKDLIERAGGFTEEAYEQHVNLALKVFDEMVIYVPAIADTPMSESPIVKMVPAATNKIRINVASKDEIATLKGIGETKAEAIITYRESNGSFQSVDDLLLVTGIGKKTLDKIRDNIQIP